MKSKFERFIEERKHTPIEKHDHWCTVCDAVTVDSTRPETGEFFNFFGHVWSGLSEWKGEYKSILFAVCTRCKSTDV